MSGVAAVSKGHPINGIAGKQLARNYGSADGLKCTPWPEQQWVPVDFSLETVYATRRQNARLFGRDWREIPLFGSVSVKNGDRDKLQRAKLHSPQKTTMLPTHFLISELVGRSPTLAVPLSRPKWDCVAYFWPGVMRIFLGHSANLITV